VPDPLLEVFRDSVNAFRCAEAIDVGRCGLYRDHDGPHAYSQIVSRKPWRCVLHRWDEGGRWVDDGSPRLAWCSIHSD